MRLGLNSLCLWSPVSRMSERGSFFPPLMIVMGNSSGVSHQISNGSDPNKGVDNIYILQKEKAK